MCPHKFSAQLDADPARYVLPLRLINVVLILLCDHVWDRVMDDLRTGALEYSKGDYPRVFYSGLYNEDDIAKGLLRSPELVMVSIHLRLGSRRLNQLTLLSGLETYFYSTVF